MRNTEFLGAGDPGALEALFEGATRGGARRALAEAYRRWGWIAAQLYPLGLSAPSRVPDLDPTMYGLLPGEEAALSGPTAAPSAGRSDTFRTPPDVTGWRFRPRALGNRPTGSPHST